VYRYSFNGKENDDEWNGRGNMLNYGFRIHDPRIGRFLSVDPLARDYPELTTFQYASNTPIQAIDIDGLEAGFVQVTFRAAAVSGLSLTFGISIAKDYSCSVYRTVGASVGPGAIADVGVSVGFYPTMSSSDGIQGFGTSFGLAGSGSVSPLVLSGEVNVAIPTKFRGDDDYWGTICEYNTTEFLNGLRLGGNISIPGCDVGYGLYAYGEATHTKILLHSTDVRKEFDKLYDEFYKGVLETLVETSDYVRLNTNYQTFRQGSSIDGASEFKESILNSLKMISNGLQNFETIKNDLGQSAEDRCEPNPSSENQCESDN
jgi:RHS repeat-associated protein